MAWWMMCCSSSAFCSCCQRRNIGLLSFVVRPIVVCFSYYCCGGRCRSPRVKTNSTRWRLCSVLWHRLQHPSRNMKKTSYCFTWPLCTRYVYALVGTVSRGDDWLFSLLVIRDQGNGGNECRVFYAELQRRLVTSHGHNNAYLFCVAINVEFK